jgi:mRNA interferase RelE/StbE
MKYSVELKPKAEKDLKAMRKDEGRRIYGALLALENGIEGDVKKLTDHWPEYRLRVGNWRALFEVQEDKIVVYRIRHRRDAYR